MTFTQMFFFLFVGQIATFLNDHMTYCLNGVCIHLKLLTFELCCNVCLFTPVVFILEVFLLIVIRLHFSLKDDEENNQIILDLAVYRSDLFSL